MHGPTGHFTQEDPIGLAGGMNLYGFAGGDPVSYSDPFGLCPYAGSTRNTDLGDCPSDNTILPAFRLIASNALGRAFIEQFASHRTSISAHKGKVSCGGKTLANACTNPFTFGIEINGGMSVADRAHSIVHETMHTINARTTLDSPWLTPAIDEEWAEAAGYTFLLSLPSSVRGSSVYGGMAAAYKKNPAAELKRGCQSEGLSNCP